MKTTTGKQSRPRNVILHGEHGRGKTTLAASFPSPIIIDIEGGCDDLDVTRTERIRDYAAFQEAVSWLITNENQYRTIVIDSVDWLESLIHHHVAETHGVKSVADVGYGKGYTAAAECFEHLLSGFRRLNQLGKGVVLIAHSKAIKVTPPDGESYDQFALDLHAKAASLLVEFSDECLFLTTKVYTRTEDLGGFKGERKLAIGGTERILVTGGTPAVVAKNRLCMPSEIPATFAEYAKYISTPADAGNIAGQVKDGSSKTKTTN